jgi:basic membrane protein A
MDIPVIRRIEKGFKQGVAYQDRSVKIISNMDSTFTDPRAGKMIALDQYGRGADIIYNAAGRTGLGVIEAAKMAGKLTLGTSGNQIHLAPGHMVGNRPKRVDKAVLELAGKLKAGTFTTGVYSFGLKDQGLGIGPFDRKIVSDDMLKRIEELKQKIINGVISIDVNDN